MAHKGFLLLAQNSFKKDESLKPHHEYKEEYPGVFVDVWYKELTHIKGQHVYYNNNVYKVLETSSPGKDFEEDKYQLLVENVKLLDDKNKLLEFNRANKDDIVLDMNKLYSIKIVDNKQRYNINKLHDFYVDIWYTGQNYFKNQIVWYDNDVYKILENTNDNNFHQIKSELLLENIKLFADNDTSLQFVDPRKNSTVLYYNHICSLEPIISENYVQQACLLASSIKKHMPLENISIITNDGIPNRYNHLFEYVIQISDGDAAEHSDWKIENRWKMYNYSPYDETIVMDVDMIVLEDISKWWDYLCQYDLYFTSKVLTYRDEIITNDSYRKVFSHNDLPNIYTGLHYFKKSKVAEEFYNLLEIICKNWQEFYKNFLPNSTPLVLSIDVAAALAVKILDIQHLTCNENSSVSFTHMKPLLQNWKKTDSSWLKSISPYINSECRLKIGNKIQCGVFHYTESSFLNTPGVELFYERI